MTEQNYIFKFKRGTKQALEQSNPVLQPGEPAVELDTGNMKVGDNDGTEYNSLPYVGRADMPNHLVSPSYFDNVVYLSRELPSEYECSVIGLSSTKKEMSRTINLLQGNVYSLTKAEIGPFGNSDYTSPIKFYDLQGNLIEFKKGDIKKVTSSNHVLLPVATDGYISPFEELNIVFKQMSSDEIDDDIDVGYFASDCDYKTEGYNYIGGGSYPIPGSINPLTLYFTEDFTNTLDENTQYTVGSWSADVIENYNLYPWQMRDNGITLKAAFSDGEITANIVVMNWSDASTLTNAALWLQNNPNEKWISFKSTPIEEI